MRCLRLKLNGCSIEHGQPPLQLVKTQSHLLAYTRELKSNWLEEKAKALHHAADTNDMKALHKGLREVYGPQPWRTTQVVAEDGTTVLKEKEKTLNRFAQHFVQLLNVPGTVDITVLDDFPDIPADKELGSVPSHNELSASISFTKENKTPGCCGIPAEVCKLGGLKLKERLHDLIITIWMEEQVPQDWKDSNIVPVFKKGSRKDSNYRGLSLLSVAGKIMARIILNS